MTKHEDSVQLLIGRIEAVRPKFDGTELSLPTPEQVLEIAQGILNSRTGQRLANAPKFTQKPLANIFHRMLAWHSSTGWLGTPFMLRADCGWLVKNQKLEMTAGQLYDQLDTMCLILTGGKSQPAKNWARVLGYEREVSN